MLRKIVGFVLAGTCLFHFSVFSQPRVLQFEDLVKSKRISDPQVSPDGKWIVCTVTEVSLEKNSSNADIFLMDENGTYLRKLTTFEKSDNSPRWSPDGNWIYFISTREGEPQIWKMAVSEKEPQPVKVTNISTGVGSAPFLSPDGKMLAFTSDVFPEFSTLPFSDSDKKNAEKNDIMEKDPVTARILDGLFYRHWNEWKDGKRTHIFVSTIDGSQVKDITPGDRDAVPYQGEDFNWSPDSREIAYTSSPEEKEEAWSTNHDIYIVNADGSYPRLITGENKGSDQSPVYSPDGNFIAYHAQLTPGYESDRWRLMLYDRKSGKIFNLTEKTFDNYAGVPIWSPDSKTLYFTSDVEARTRIFSLPALGGTPREVFKKSSISAAELTPDGKQFVLASNSMTSPMEIFSVSVDGKNPKQLTKFNNDLFSQFELNPVEDVWYDGAGGIKVHGLLVKPPKFDPKKKYPMIVWIHGGPQGAWEDNWHYRWNPQMFAAQGYVMFLPNPRGSTGYGQQFCLEISGDWGGKVYTDIMNGVDHVLKTFPFVDGNRLGAGGGSYGGYLTNWIAGHTDRFKALVSHAGVYELRSMYSTTEELWFPEFEFKGTPWDNPEMIRKWNPADHVKNFKTPTLVIHGEQDFRVPIGQGMAFFTDLQRMGVPSKFLYFPDEGHWVLKPRNSQLWHKEYINWMNSYLKP